MGGPGGRRFDHRKGNTKRVDNGCYGFENLPMKRRDITEKVLNMALNTKQRHKLPHRLPSISHQHVLPTCCIDWFGHCYICMWNHCVANTRFREMKMSHASNKKDPHTKHMQQTTLYRNYIYKKRNIIFLISLWYFYLLSQCFLKAS